LLPQDGAESKEDTGLIFGQQNPNSFAQVWSHRQAPGNCLGRCPWRARGLRQLTDP